MGRVVGLRLGHIQVVTLALGVFARDFVLEVAEGF